MITRVLKVLLGDPQKKILKGYDARVDAINALEPTISALSDEELQAKTDHFRQRLQEGETLEDLLVEVFATVREVAKRVLSMRHFDVQLIGGMVLHEGCIAEMKTGEGKTLVATLPAYLNALEGKGVYIVTVNDYLARRDSEWMGQVYRFLGLNVGLIQSGMESDERLHAYQCDITFGTNNEFGFDYLRDNLVGDVSQLSQVRQHYAIIDEVDSILIDEARTPLIISGPVKDSTSKYIKIAKIVRRLHRDKDFTMDEKHKNIVLTEQGIETIEKEMGLSNIFSVANMDAAHMAVQCLKAMNLFKRDVDYVVKEGEVVIVDEFTGRLMEGRRYSDGLHQAIEAAEGLSIREESQTLASITFQNYFRMFPKLAGMTGTAATEASEFANIYGLGVVVVPTNMPMIREDHSDVVYKTKQEKYRAIVNVVAEVVKKGQPVLVGTIAIETSELLSSMLKRKGVAHHVLNAKHHEKEADIIARAGQKSSVTIATNMAGRGTDIVLGEGVKAAGGLYVIGSERHESRRIDNQLRGRSGRQGDVGETRFYVCLEDDLMRLFGSDRIAKIMETLGMPDDTPIEHKLVTRSIAKAQSKVEKYHFGIRKQILQYDDVINKQRETIYGKRRRILRQERIDELYRESVDIAVTALFHEFPLQELKEGVQKDEFIKQLQVVFPVTNLLSMIDDVLKKTDPQKQLVDAIERFYEFRKNEHPEGIFESFVSKRIFLMTLDRQWMDHLHNMDVLREGIGLRAYGQRDPLIEYKREGFVMFKEFMLNLSQESLMMINRAVVSKQEEDIAPVQQKQIQENRSGPVTSVRKKGVKRGRNERVTILKEGVKKEVKWKVAESLIQNEGWQLVS